MILYECPDFEVIYRSGKPDFLMLTFSSLGMFGPSGSFANGSVFWGQSLADKRDFSAIGFVAKQRNWFCSDRMPGACEEVARAASSYRQVVAYGSSMGGYAALRWGKLAGASACVAFAPQFSINPEVVATFDRRYEYAFRPDLHPGMEIRSEHVTSPAFLFVDPTEAKDWMHAKLIHNVAPALNVMPLFSCGHECIRVFGNSELAARLLHLSASGDVARVRSLIRDARRVTAIRPFELANRVVNRRPMTAWRIFDKYQSGFEIDQRSAILERLQTARPRVPPNSISPRKVDVS